MANRRDTRGDGPNILVSTRSPPSLQERRRTYLRRLGLLGFFLLQLLLCFFLL